MRTGDKVIYCKRHYEWLISANRWSNPATTRESVTGHVTGFTDEGHVRVHWTGPALYKEVSPIDKIHFSDNLEIVP